MNYLPNRTLLDPVTYCPGYVTKDGKWAAVPCGNEFMILNEGKQIKVFPTIAAAKDFIANQVKATTGISAVKSPKKSKKQSKATLAPFIK